MPLCVVIDVEPVALLPAVAVERQRIPVDCFGDEEGHQLFGILVGTKGVAAARDDRIQAVGNVAGANQ